MVGAALTAGLLGGWAGPVGAVAAQDPGTADVAESTTTTSEVVPSSTTAPPTTAAPVTTTTEAAPQPTTPVTAPAVVEDEEVEFTTTVVEEEVEEEPASTTTAETTPPTVVRRAPIPSTTEAVPSTTEGSRTGRSSVGSTREEEGADDDSQQVVRLVIGLLVVIALLIAVLTWRYWRYTDPRRGYAPSRAWLPAGGPESAATAPASEPAANGATVAPAPPQPVGVAPNGVEGVASGGAATDEPTSVFDGMELYGAGRTTLPQDIDPTDPGPGTMGFARQPERVGGSDPGTEAAPADGTDPGR